MHLTTYFAGSVLLRTAQNSTPNKIHGCILLDRTRTSILGHSHTKAKIVVAVVGLVVVPFTDDAVLRVIVPAAAAFDAVITGSSTFFYPYRLALL